MMVVFRDEYNQHPVVIGTLAGIPTAEEAPKVTTTQTESTVIRSGDGSVVTDGSGQPITANNQEVEKKIEPAPEPANEFKRPSAMSTSEEGFTAIRSKEGLASTLPNRGNRPKIGNNSTPGSAVIYAYLDTAKPPRWTIGWGNTYLEDMKTRVVESTTRTKAQCDELLKLRVKSDDEPAIRKLVTAPLTQSMFDACISLIYNMGRGNFVKSEFRKALNAAKYEEAAALILTTLTNNGTLKGRREKEKALFLKDGIPQDDGTAKQIPKEETVVPDATQNPAVIKDQRFVPARTAADVVQLANPGFTDPNGVYPKRHNEPDTHRLARHERIDGTIVFKKEVARAKGVATACGKTWTQPFVPYNARYPYNRVYASESGHVQEFDDTPQNERVHTYHRSGTYTEVDCNGSQVNRIVGDSFQILERNGNVIIRGTCNITVEGDANIRTENNANVYAGAGINLKAVGSIGISAGGDLILNAGGAIRGLSGGETSFDGSAVHLNSGKGVASPALANVSGDAFPALSTPSRFSEGDANYETLEEGDPPAEFLEAQVERGAIVPDEPEPAQPVSEVSTPDPKKPEPIVEVKPDTTKTDNYTKAYRLSTNFTLGDVVTGSNNAIPNGPGANEIVFNLKNLTVNVLEHVKRRYPNMIITNTYRSAAKNASLPGSSKTSKHLTGEAADIQISGFNRRQTYEVAKELKSLIPSFDKLILEYKGSSTWIHIQYVNKGNRNQCLTLNVVNGKTVSLNSNGFTLLEG